MKRFFTALFILLFAFVFYAHGAGNAMSSDTSDVISLNKQAYDERLTSPEQTVNIGNKALALGIKLNFDHGIAEAYRVIGIGQYYLNMPEQSINSYINALTYFLKSGDKRGEAKVDNNIGNLYRDNDFDRSLIYFQKALAIGNEISDKSLIATSYLNLGNFYVRKESFNKALKYYDQSESIFTALQDSVNIIQCSQNRGVVYYKLNQLDMAEKLLTDANKKAKERDLNEAVAGIDLTLAASYIARNKFNEAENIIAEGLAYSNIIKDEKLAHDFKYTNYELEYKRKNYLRALVYLSQVYHQDSVDDKTNLSSQINLFEVKNKQEEEQKVNELNMQRIQYENIRFWGAVTVAGLLMVTIGLLVNNVKRKTKTNAQLTELNEEVSRQKDNLDRVNHHLEEIIDERTRDLQIKNKKLSEYSSYLSHQIRGPIATLKGLMNLEKEGLVDKQECIKMMDKCVSEIDEKIIEMSDMMHDPRKA
jgi:tetratricopeptide (TPR) repeat protein